MPIAFCSHISRFLGIALSYPKHLFLIVITLVVFRGFTMEKDCANERLGGILRM
jgi:hypothetical protein